MAKNIPCLNKLNIARSLKYIGLDKTSEQDPDFQQTTLPTDAGQNQAWTKMGLSGVFGLCILSRVYILFWEPKERIFS